MDKLKLIEAILNSECQKTSATETNFWEIGKDYYVRTITMVYVGVLKCVSDKELLFTDVAWIPETSRWNEFLKGAAPKEMEPYVNDVIIGRGAILDATKAVNRIDRVVI